MNQPPEYVLAAFGLGSTLTGRLPTEEGRVWRYGDTVVKPVTDPVEAAWSAGVFDSLRVTRVRLPRPVRASDGRWVVSGWSAHRFVSGRPARRYQETIAAGEVLHAALADIPVPKFIALREGLLAWADRFAWGESSDQGRIESGHGAELLHRIAAGRRPLRMPAQVIHGDLFGNVLFAGSAPPAIIDFTPFHRPAAYASALVVVDAMAWGDAPADVAEVGQRIPEWGQLLRRAVLARIALNLTHPRSTPASLVGVLTAAESLAPMMD